ncbi:unnamed protein product [Phaeothamnion confervicola]
MTSTSSWTKLAAELLSRWQRDINRFSDESVAVRRRSLAAICGKVEAVVAYYGTAAAAPIADLSASDDGIGSGSDGNGGGGSGFVSSGHVPAAQAALEAVISDIFAELAKPLFRRFADPAEPCRETAARLSALLVGHTADLTPHLAYLLPATTARGVAAGAAYDTELQLFVHDAEDHEAYRRGRATERQDRAGPTVPHRVVEPGEEVRLLQCCLVATAVMGAVRRGAAAVLRPYLDEIVLYSQYQTRDAYSELKVRALELLTFMARAPALELTIKAYAVGLVRAVLPSLRHKHARVRMAALAAVWALVQVPDRAKCRGAGTAAIVDLVGFREDNVLPIAGFYGRGDTVVNHLAELAADAAASVRQRVAEMLGDWLTTLPDRFDHHSRLLPYVLNALTDDSPGVSAAAAATLRSCGAEYEREHEGDVIERRQFGVDGDTR